MTTTTRKAPEANKVADEPIADRAVEQQGMAMYEAPPADTLPGANGEAQLVARRGRQRTPKPRLMALLCRLGIHRGQWAFVAEGNCAQGRECERCGFVHARTEHLREWRYVRASFDEQVRICGRCNAVSGERNRHEWSETQVLERRHWQGNREAHYCLRCGVVKEWTAPGGD